MNKITRKISSIIGLGILVGLQACKEPFDADPAPATAASAYTANFLFANVSDAASLDLYINNIKMGTSEPTASNQTGYTNVGIASAFGLANTGIRAKASSGTIGGVLGSSDLIYRATSVNTALFTAIDKNYYSGTGRYAGYTIFAVDSIKRPKPIRTYNAAGLADVTYYSPVGSFKAKSVVDGVTDTTIQLSVGSNNSIVTANLVKKYNANKLPGFLVSLGSNPVPLGSTDPGGIRFYAAQDVFPVYAKADSTAKAGIRFFHTSPTAASSLTSPTASYVNALYVRLLAPTIISINNSSTTPQFSYVMSSNPNVGSNTPTAPTAANFTLQTLTNGGVYTIQVSTKSDFSVISASKDFTFVASKNYTIYTTGFVQGTGSNALGLNVIQHN